MAPDGSIIIVIATDAPLDARNLGRMAARAMMGLARTGAAASNGSGDYAIAFSTAADVRIRPASQNERNIPRNLKTLGNDATSPLFLAVIEATEEAIYNSLFRATHHQRKGPNGRSAALGPYRRNPSKAWSNCAFALVRTITTSSRWSNLFIRTGKLFDTPISAA